MNEERIKQLIECENRLLKDRKLINELMEECQAGNISGIIEIKIENLQREVGYMNRQLALIRQEYDRNRQEGVRPFPLNQGPAELQQLTPEQNKGMPGGFAKKTNMEKTLGTSIMAICASVLIFISLVLFATLVLPYLTQTVKMGLMYAVSLSFAAFGMILLRKNRDNKWYLSVAGCGMGAVYLSLFVSRIYFRAFHDLTLYVFIFLWALVVCLLSRHKSAVFLTIGQIGIAISVLFGTVLCCAGRDEKKLLFLAVYVLAAEAVFYLSHIRKEYQKNLLNHSFLAVCFFLLLPGIRAGFMRKSPEGVAAALLLTAAALAPVLLSLSFFAAEEKTDASFGILNTLYFAVMWLAFCGRFERLTLVMSGLAALLLIGMEFRFKNKRGVNAGRLMFQITLFIAMFCGLTGAGWAREHVSVSIFAVCCLIYGFCRKDAVYKAAGFVYGALFLLVPMHCWLHVFWGFVIVSVLTILLYRFREQYDTRIKVTAYPLFLVFLIEDGLRIFGKLRMRPFELQILLLLLLLASVNFVMSKVSALRRHPGTGAKENGVITETGIVNLVLMAVSLFCIRETEPFFYHAWAILQGLAIFMINSGNLLKQYGGRWGNVYVGTKFLIFVLTVLDSFSAPDFCISMAGLIFAAVFITAGFLAERRTEKNFGAIRIYGLVLAFLGILKLILLDIYYDSVPLRAAGFFVSGLLCFVISLIYHMADKKLAKKE